MVALGLTDHRTLTGSIDFIQACKEAGIQPILGLEIDMDGGRLPLFATLDAVGRVGKRVTIAGVRQTSHRSRTAKGELMMFLTLEDLSGTLDVVLFPNAYRQAKNIVNSASPFLITGVMEMDTERGEPFLNAEQARLI